MVTSETILGAVAIFFLRIVNSSVGTGSVITAVQGRRWLTAILTAISGFIFAVVVSRVIQDLSNWPNLLAYCAGFAAGNYVGMVLEARFVASYINVTMITPNGGHELAAALRREGYGVTETHGEDSDGRVTMLQSVIVRQNLPRLMKTIETLNPEAFVTVDAVRSVQRGWIQSLRGHHDLHGH